MPAPVLLPVVPVFGLEPEIPVVEPVPFTTALPLLLPLCANAKELISARTAAKPNLARFIACPFSSGARDNRTLRRSFLTCLLSMRIHVVPRAT